MNFEEKQLSSQVIYNGKIVRLELDNVRLPDGTTSFRECVRHSGGAAVLLVKDGEVLLVKQYRYVYGKELYEIPAGKINDGEDVALAASRELEEETGYRAKLRHLTDLYPTPGYTDEIIHIYIATEFEYVKQRLDEGEFLKCEFVPLDKAFEMIKMGELCDAKTVVALYGYLYNRVQLLDK